MVRAIWLPGLAFLAVSQFAIGLDCEVGGCRLGMGGQGAVSALRAGGARTGKDSGCIRPVEKKVKDYSQEGFGFACWLSAVLRRSCCTNAQRTCPVSLS